MIFPTCQYDAHSTRHPAIRGPLPELGDRVVVDFGDAPGALPLLRGIVTGLGLDRIEVNGARHLLDSMASVEVIAP